MVIGVPKEIKKHEYRVGMTPAAAASYVRAGHAVMVERGAGGGAGYGDDEYRAAGAAIEADKAKLFSKADMIVKVKEPLAEEYPLFRPGQILYTYLHLAADLPLVRMLLEKKVSAVAYETIELADRSLPCLTPMSEIAGRLAVQEGAKFLEKEFGGRGVLLGGVPGVQRGKVAILGGGVVGTNAAKIAVGMGAQVTVLDISARRLAYLDDIFGSSLTTLYATESNIEHALRDSDLVIGAVLVTGESAPKLILRKHLALMQPGAVIVDVAIDQGGCAETSHPTTHDDPIYIVDGIVHYCVANMPGAVARTSTIALVSTTLPFGLEIAGRGLEAAAGGNPAIRKGVNAYRGKCTHPGVAKSCGLDFTEFGA